MKNGILGVIGGLGPLATAYFMERVVEMTDAEVEQDHVDMIVYNYPSIPDRTSYILGNDLNSPLPKLRSTAQTLDRQGVRCIAMPCVTAHYFHSQLQKTVSTPIINGIFETAAILRLAGISRVGIMATDGTIRSGLLTRALEQMNICPLLPSRQRQQDVMHLIYNNVKAKREVEMSRFRSVGQSLLDQGCEVILLGCTELSLIRRDHPLEGCFLDVMDVLARSSVLRCGKRLKPQYQNLLKGVAPDADQSSGISGKNRRPFAG